MLFSVLFVIRVIWKNDLRVTATLTGSGALFISRAL